MSETAENHKITKVVFKNLNFSPIFGQKSYGETNIFEKVRKFWSRKIGLQAVYTMCKGFQDLGPFLGVMFLTKVLAMQFVPAYTFSRE